MIPYHLRLRNFMSYGDEPVELDLTGVHLACLSGGNGNGKSALLDAITWALWGRSRAKREDDLVRLGATEMEVELGFACGGGQYRLLRKRTLRRSGGTAALELQALGEGGYSSITGGTINETQARVHDILKLGYETFINSAFLLQGRADEFTVKPPSQRKAVLAEILGLEEYERLSQRARDLAREGNGKVTGLRERVATVEADLAQRPRLHAELVGLEDRRADAAAAVRAAERALWEAQAERQSLEGERKALKEAQGALAERDREIDTLCKRRDAALLKVQDADRLLVNEQRIVAEAAELRRLRAELADMVVRAGQARELERPVTRLESEIEAEAAHLRSEIKAALTDAQRSARAAATVPLLQRQVEEYSGAEARVPAVETERAARVDKEQALRAEVATLRAANTHLDAEMKPLRERIKLLKEPGAACPVCGKAMDETERQRIHDRYIADGVEKRDTLKRNETRVAEITARLDELVREVARLDATLAALRKNTYELGMARERLTAADEAATVEREARARADVAQRSLDDGDYAHQARARLVDAQARVRAIGYDAGRYQALQKRVETLETTQSAEAELATARERRANALSEIAAVEADLARRQGEQVERLAAVAALRAVLAGLPEVEARLAACSQALDDRRRAEKSLNDRVTGLSVRLQQLDEQEEQLRGKRAALAAAEQEADAYAELGRLFGKAGIQAMLIDNALPELEQGANRILARMSDSGMQVQFATQTQGSKGDLLETLDIKIADARGTRPYEMFSGGEAFRVNFAIRIALSQLLAERAGTQLRMLVVDEGFGTQDSQGREQLVEAINSISADFERIIVVTHIDELKDMFPTRIDVVKGLDGSQVTVTAA